MDHVFVDVMPKSLERGKLYISLKYNAVLHLCACGCGNEVSTPLNPTQWKMSYNGATVSLTPSIGNWSYPCKSHYFITNNEVRWSGNWDNNKIQQARKYDQQVRAKYNARQNQTSTNQKPNEEKPKKKGFWGNPLGD
jgi:hypothetical protein